MVVAQRLTHKRTGCRAVGGVVMGGVVMGGVVMEERISQIKNHGNRIEKLLARSRRIVAHSSSSWTGCFPDRSSLFITMRLFHGCWQIFIFISFPFLSSSCFWLHDMFGVILIFGGNDLYKHRWRLVNTYYTHFKHIWMAQSVNRHNCSNQIWKYIKYLK